MGHRVSAGGRRGWASGCREATEDPGCHAKELHLTQLSTPLDPHANGHLDAPPSLNLVP